MLYGQFMTTSNLITAAEATRLLGYENRSSLTRLVQAGKITPAFTASGKRGEQFFNRVDVDALLTSPAAPSSVVSPPAIPTDGGASTVSGAA